MKRIFIVLFVAGVTLVMNSSSAAIDGYCDGMGDNKEFNGSTQFWCPLDGGKTKCAYKKPTSGCGSTTIGGGGSN